MKKAVLVILSISLQWACATFRPQPPAFYLEDLPESMTIPMTLEQRIAAEDVWNNLKSGNSARAQKGIAKLGPDNPIYYVSLGYLQFQANDIPAAEQSFQEALKRDPDLILAYLGLAQIAELQNLDEEVYSEYSEILKREPNHPWVKPRFDALRNKRTDDFLAEAKRCVAAGEVGGGKKAFLKALFYSPESQEAHLNLARIYRKEKNTSSALLHFKAAGAGTSESKALLKEYADTLYDAEQFGRSLDIYELLAEKDPQNKNVNNRIESLKNKLGIYELPSLYNTIPDAEAITREDLAALIAVKFKGLLDDSGVSPPILIDISTSWAAKFILKVTALNVMDVFENHTFLPKKIINRAELAECLVRLIGYLKGKGQVFTMQMSPGQIQLSDVPPENYYFGPISQIIAYQIMDLSLQKAFRPDAIVGGKEAVKTLDIILALAK